MREREEKRRFNSLSLVKRSPSCHNELNSRVSKQVRRKRQRKDRIRLTISTQIRYHCSNSHSRLTDRSSSRPVVVKPLDLNFWGSDLITRYVISPGGRGGGGLPFRPPGDFDGLERRFRVHPTCANRLGRVYRKLSVPILSSAIL